MVRDFTVSVFRTLLHKFTEAGYTFQSCREYHDSPMERVIFLRHDVDKLPGNALVTAQIENEAGIAGTYYFRSQNGNFEEDTIKQVRRLGHEIGYHYEDMAIASRKSKVESQKSKGNVEEMVSRMAFDLFRGNLVKLRSIVPIETICMHGSPTSRWDSRLLWKYNDYRELGITAEPYLDFSFDNMLYLTDTGRRWDGASVSIRDKTAGNGISSLQQYNEWKVKPLRGSLMNMTTQGTKFQGKHKFRHSDDVLAALDKGELPGRIMVTFHPQRWNGKTIPWLREYFWQNSKNAVKYFMIKKI